MNTNFSEIESTKVVNPAENANAPAGKNGESGRTLKGSRKTSRLWSTVTKARKTFEKQLHKSNDLKRECLENLIPAVTSDVEHFWSDYMDEVNILLDSKKFEKECGALKIEPIILATHIVFLGAGKRNAVIKNGIFNTLGSKCRDFSEQFVPDLALKYGLNYVPEKTEDSENVSTDTAA